MKKRDFKNKKLLSFIAAALSAVTAACIVIYSVPDFSGKEYTFSGTESNFAVALTFDDGPSDYTEELLDGLKKYGAKATFFVLGKRAEKHPDTIKRIYSEGHLLGNHSFEHISMLTSALIPKNLKASIEKTADAVERLTGERPVFFRAPHGYVLPHQKLFTGTVFVDWSYDTYDWKHQDSDYVYNEVKKAAKDGAIILLHDTKKTTVEGVLRAVKELKDEGVDFVRVDELLSRNGAEIKSGVIYKKCEKRNKKT